MRLEFTIEMRLIAEEPAEEEKASRFNEEVERCAARQVPGFDESLFNDLLQIVRDLGQLSDRATARSHRKETQGAERWQCGQCGAVLPAGMDRRSRCPKCQGKLWEPASSLVGAGVEGAGLEGAGESVDDESPEFREG